MQEIPNKKSISFAGILLGISFICLAAVLITVIRSTVIRIEEGERGIVISPYGFRAPYGYLDETLTPGLHFIVPGERVQTYDVSPQTYILSSPNSIEAKTLDGKTILVDISVVYALDPEKVLDMFINWQGRYEDELIRPLLRNTTRNTISKYDFFEINTQTTKVERDVSDKLNTQFTENYLMLLKFSIITSIVVF